MIAMHAGVEYNVNLALIFRYMGEGFVVMMSNLVELYFYMDEAGMCYM